MRRELGISHTTAGLVVGLPVLLLGLSALPGAAMTRRWGAYRTVVVGLGLLTVGALIRTWPGGLAVVLVGTAVLATGIGVAQPPLARLAQTWFPARVQRAATVMTLGLLIGGIAGAAVTPLAVHSVAGNWRGSFLFWSLVAAAGFGAWVAVARRSPDGSVPPTPLQVWPLLADARVRWVTVIFAAQAITFYTTNAWIAAASTGGAGTASATLNLVFLNGVSVPVTLALTRVRRTFTTSRPFYVAAGALSTFGAGAWALAGPGLGPLWAVLLGAGGTMALVGATAYAPTSFPPARVAAVAATVWTIGYVAAFAGPPLAGLGIDVLHSTRAPFAMCVCFSLLLIIAGARLPAPRLGPARSVGVRGA